MKRYCVQFISLLAVFSMLLSGCSSPPAATISLGEYIGIEVEVQEVAVTAEDIEKRNSLF